MSGRIGAGLDLIELLAGAFQTGGQVSKIKGDAAKLKPQIDQALAQKNVGVLLVVRTETSGIGGHISTVLGVYYGGCHQRPEGLVSKWQNGDHIWPAPKGTVSETYLWVVKNLASEKPKPRPPGYYPAQSPQYNPAPVQDLKIVRYDQLF